MKNQCSRTRDVNNPYLVYRNNENWEFRVLKRYQSPENELKNAYARWFCAVKSPMTFGRYDLGDCYIKHVVNNAYLVNNPILDKW